MPNFLERLGFRLNLAPSPYLDIFAVGAYRAVSLANRLDIFEKLRDRPQTAKEVAGSIGSDERATKILLEFLEACGYLKRSGERFANSSMTNKWVLRSPKGSFSDAIRTWDELLEFWSANEEETMRNGKPNVTIYDWFNRRPGSWRTFHDEERWYASMFGGEITAKLKIPEKARRLLDVGGGHGMYSVMLCRRHPNLAATVFDQPKVLEFTRDILASEKISDRISMQPGDFLVDDLGSGYDIALLFNIIHGLLPEKIKELLHRAAKSLNAGGMLVIFDQFTGDEFGPVQRASNRFWGLTYLTLLGGQVYSSAEVKDWLMAAGFDHVSRVNIRVAASSLLIGKRTFD
jgi:hypothetical protein